MPACETRRRPRGLVPTQPGHLSGDRDQRVGETRDRSTMLASHRDGVVEVGTGRQRFALRTSGDRFEVATEQRLEQAPRRLTGVCRAIIDGIERSLGRTDHLEQAGPVGIGGLVSIGDGRRTSGAR